MLRAIFGQPKRSDEGKLAETNRAIRSFCKSLRERYDQDRVEERWIRLDLWASGLIVALDELEQSIYCSEQYASQDWPKFENEMDEQERDNYYRYIYYYKNAFIRLFSILDKTGYFLDLLFELETGKIKSKFSYFTVLRQMHLGKTHALLEQSLFELKVKYRDPLDRLRKKRNLEIHSMNAELIDDMWRSQSRFADCHAIEQIADQLKDLQLSYEMTMQSLLTIFQYCLKYLRQGKFDSGAH